MVEFEIEKELKYSILYLKVVLVLSWKQNILILVYCFGVTSTHIHILVTYSVRFRIVSVSI